MSENLIPRHGGYRNLKSFRIAQLIYDLTVQFCDKYIDKRSRTHDQMVQAARSGVQNIAEGSMDSAISKKIEMKLTGVARGSLEELKLDYQDFLRHRSLPQWPPDHPALKRFRERRCATLQQFFEWEKEEIKILSSNTDKNGQNWTEGQQRSSTESASPCWSVPANSIAAVIEANGTLSLLNLCIYFLSRQLEAQAKAFEQEGGFTERLYRHRIKKRGENESN